MRVALLPRRKGTGSGNFSPVVGLTRIGLSYHDFMQPVVAPQGDDYRNFRLYGRIMVPAVGLTSIGLVRLLGVSGTDVEGVAPVYRRLTVMGLPGPLRLRRGKKLSIRCLLFSR